MPLTKFSANIVIAVLATSLVAQKQPSPVPASADAAATPPEISEVHIDQFCRVLTPGKPSPRHPDPVARYRYNSVVCHIESNLSSSHTEQTTKNGVPKLVYVSVHEREYLLQNVTSQPVTFVVDQTLRKGWRIDSDPQPTEINGTTATFRVFAQPGQIVRLHVGARS
jgi:hypothetical protein